MVVIIDNVLAVEDGEKGYKETSIPVISYPASIITLTSQIGEGIQRNLFILVKEHLFNGEKK